MIRVRQLRPLLSTYWGTVTEERDESKRTRGVPDNLNQFTHVDVVWYKELGLVQDGKLLFSFITLNDHLQGNRRQVWHQSAGAQISTTSNRRKQKEAGITYTGYSVGRKRLHQNHFMVSGWRCKTWKWNNTDRKFQTGQSTFTVNTCCLLYFTSGFFFFFPHYSAVFLLGGSSH